MAAMNSGGRLDAVNLPAIVPFCSDMDITKGGDIYWDLDPVNGKITITWANVTPYSGSGANSFQVVLSDTGGGDFDAEVIYGDIQWSASGGGPQAATGITDGGSYTAEFEGSGNATDLTTYESNDFGGVDGADLLVGDDATGGTFSLFALGSAGTGDTFNNGTFTFNSSAGSTTAQVTDDESAFDDIATSGNQDAGAPQILTTDLTIGSTT